MEIYSKFMVTLKAILYLVSSVMLLLAHPLMAADALGSVTKLPIPRYISLKAEKANIRRGPSTKYKIDWIFAHQTMPIRVTGEYGNWRRVEDWDGQGGWIHESLITGKRMVRVMQNDVLIRRKPNFEAISKVKAEKGALLKLGRCDIDWCEVSQGRYSGWLPKTVLWGVFPDEIRE